MKSFAIASIALATTLFGSSYLGKAQDPGSPTNKVLYQRTGAEGTIAGTITLTGDPPKLRHLDTSADPVCGAMNSDLLT